VSAAREPAARLVAPTSGDDLSPTALRWTAQPLDEAALEAARTLAFERGRVLERDGAAVLTWGEAARVELTYGLAEPGAASQATPLLAAIPALERPGHSPEGGLSWGPLALGALGFDRNATTTLVLPAVSVVHDEHGTTIATAVGRPDELVRILAGFPFADGAAPPVPWPPSEPPDRFELVSVRPHADFRERVALALQAIRSGAFDKVVLAREVAVHANRPFRQHDLLRRMRALHPSCAAFAVDGFVGASPELLCRRQGAEVTSQPLAGTVARSGDPDEDARLAAELLASEKERNEHRIVVDAIVAALEPWCGQVEVPAVPHLLELRNVAHLASPVRATLRADAAGAPSVLELLAALHPTPAVGGWPREPALEYLAKAEELDRDRYAGPVGWVDARGDGAWWIGIRSAILDGGDARLIAGVGIVEGSDPAAELAETQLKLQALLAAAVRP
jgi:menaquinone-specific isochorismate synthase